MRLDKSLTRIWITTQRIWILNLKAWMYQSPTMLVKQPWINIAPTPEDFKTVYLICHQIWDLHSQLDKWEQWLGSTRNLWLLIKWFKSMYLILRIKTFQSFKKGGGIKSIFISLAKFIFIPALLPEVLPSVCTSFSGILFVFIAIPSFLPAWTFSLLARNSASELSIFSKVICWDDIDDFELSWILGKWIFDFLLE